MELWAGSLGGHHWTGPVGRSCSQPPGSWEGQPAAGSLKGRHWAGPVGRSCSQPPDPWEGRPATQAASEGRWTRGGWKFKTLFSLGESMKRPAVTDSVSDIFELDDSQPMTSGGPLAANGANGLGVGGRPVGAPGNVHQAQAQHHRPDQYLQHNCNPRHNHNINAMSIETDVWQNGTKNIMY